MEDRCREAFSRARDDALIPVLAAIHDRATEEFIGAVKARDDIERFEVTDDTRDALPAELATRIRDHLSRQSLS